MKSIIRITLIILLITNHQTLITLNAQVAVNSDGASPDASAMLDVTSTSKGILIPRMTTTERETISSPATGLLVYDTDENSFWYYNGTSWTEVGSAAFISENGLTQSVNNDDDFIFGADSLNYGTGSEYKFFFDKSKGAFRAGLVRFDAWDESNLGDYSAAFGEETQVSGANSFAAGEKNFVSGDYSTAFGSSNWGTNDYAFANGYNNQVSGRLAAAFGSTNNVSNNYSLAVGYNNDIDGQYAITFGADNDITGHYSATFGKNNDISNNYSFAFGDDNDISSEYSFASGEENNLSGKYSSALGHYLKVPSYNEIAIGFYNTDYTPVSASSVDDTDRLFVIGNGTADNSRSDAFVVHKNGDISLNGALTIDSSYTFPITDGASGEAITTDGAGNLTWSSTIVGATTSVQDTDGDTKIQVEESSDEDIIRFDLGGTEFLRLNSGRIEILNTGSSVFIGEGAGENDDYSNNNNVFLGQDAGSQNTTGNENIFIGASSGYKNTTGKYNIFLGYETGRNNKTGQENTYLGYSAGYDNTTGSGNVFIGHEVGYDETGSNKLYIDNSDTDSPLLYGEFDNDLLRINGTLDIKGNYTFPNIDGSASQILTTDGNGTLSWTTQNDTLLTDADGDTKIQVEESSDEDIIRFDLGGTEFLRLDSGRIKVANTGYSIFLGSNTGINDDFTDNANVFIGNSSGRYNTSGYHNVGLGNHANQDNTTGYGNVALGYGAGFTNAGSENVFLGYRAGYNEAGSNKLYIENSNATSPLIYGEFDNDRVVINGNDTDNSNNRTLFVNGSIGATSAFNNDSDRRLKTDIQTIPNALNKILEMRGVTYQWKDGRETGNRMGFIAQEVEPILPQVVDNKNDHYTMQYAPITAVLVEAVKEQQTQMKEQQTQIETLQSENTVLKGQAKKINQLEQQNAEMKAMLEQIQVQLNNQ